MKKMMKKMKNKNKILLANMLTVVCAVLSLLSFSAMQGFAVATVVAIVLGIYFASATMSFAKIENILRKGATNNISFVSPDSCRQDKSAKAA